MIPSVKSTKILAAIERWTAVLHHPNTNPETCLQAENQIQALRQKLVEVLARGESPEAIERRRIARLKEELAKDRVKVRKEKSRAEKKRVWMKKAETMERALRAELES